MDRGCAKTRPQYVSRSVQSVRSVRRSGL